MGWLNNSVIGKEDKLLQEVGASYEYHCQEMGN